jgi:hypothetical protein
MAFSVLNREDQQVFIGSGQVYGVQSVSASYSLPEAPLEFIGLTDVIPIPQGQQVGDVAFEILAVDSDPFIKCISKESFNGYIMEDSSTFDKYHYSFNSGYLLNYASSCSVGEIPKVAAQFRIVGDMGTIPTGDMAADAQIETRNITNVTKTDPDFRIPTASSIEITLDDFETNLVKNYNFSISLPRKDYYKIGSRSPYQVKVDFPIVAAATFTIEINDYTGNTIKDFPCKQKVKDFKIKVKAQKTHEPITEFAFSGATLVSENYTTDIENNAQISATYRCYISDLITLDGNLDTPELKTQTY